MAYVVPSYVGCQKSGLVHARGINPPLLECTLLLRERKALAARLFRESILILTVFGTRPVQP